MKILVVEDEPSIALGLQRGLSAEGYAVEVAADGHTGLEVARGGAHDLIILDIMLPGPNGYVICQTLRDEGLQTPILMLTAKDGEYDEAEGLDTGADDFLCKPFSTIVLNARVRSLLRRGAADRSAVLAVGDLRIDPAAQTVVRDGRPLDLTPREFALLRHLVHNAGIVLSKSEILEGVWDHAFDGDPNIVEVYIGRLRSKVDKPFDQQMISTVRGVGYRLDAR